MKNLMYVVFCLLIIGVSSVGADANDCYEECDNETKKWMVKSSSAATQPCFGTTRFGKKITWPCPETAWLYMEDCGCEVGGAPVEEGGEKCKDKRVMIKEYIMTCPFSMFGLHNYQCERGAETVSDTKFVKNKICVDCP